eukprot:g32619.t1
MSTIFLAFHSKTCFCSRFNSTSPTTKSVMRVLATPLCGCRPHVVRRRLQGMSEVSVAEASKDVPKRDGTAVAQKLVAQSREPSPHPSHYQVRRIPFYLHIRWIQSKTLSTPKTINHHSGTSRDTIRSRWKQHDKAARLFLTKQKRDRPRSMKSNAHGPGSPAGTPQARPALDKAAPPDHRPQSHSSPCDSPSQAKDHLSKILLQRLITTIAQSPSPPFPARSIASQLRTHNANPHWAAPRHGTVVPMLWSVLLLTKGRCHIPLPETKQKKHQSWSSDNIITLRLRLRVPIVTCHHITRSLPRDYTGPPQTQNNTFHHSLSGHHPVHHFRYHVDNHRSGKLVLKQSKSSPVLLIWARWRRSQRLTNSVSCHGRSLCRLKRKFVR